MDHWKVFKMYIAVDGWCPTYLTKFGLPTANDSQWKV